MGNYKTKTRKGERFTLLSNPSKMPGKAWGIPASTCIKGSALRNIAGSVCSKCYAHRNFYRMSNVQKTLQLRLEHYNEDPDNWIEEMIRAISYEDCRHFRWFDSGDLQSKEMLEDIFEVCEATRDVNHWIATREHNMVVNSNPPSNTIIRVSASMIGQAPPNFNHNAIWGSAVNQENYNCPSSDQHGKCLGCRACWNPGQITYKLH